MRKADTHISLKTAVKGLSVMSALMMLVCSPLNVRAEDMEGTQTEGGHGLGYIYVPFDDEIPFIAQNDSELPLLYESRYYNGYELGLLPEVRDQGSEGACWAFASIGAAEADLIHDGAGTGIDLSEMQIAYFTSHYYTDPTGCHNNDNTYYDGAAGTWLSNGGCVQMAYRAMMDGVGIVTEQTVPYRAGSSLNSYTLSDEYAYGYNAYQLKGAYIININDTNGIKTAIRQHGGVAVSIFAKYGNTYYNSANNAYYCTISDHNHGVLLVGWDDNFSRMNFNATCRPSSNGAWLVRNSWGEDGYGLDGYFWISYEDAGLIAGEDAYALDVDTDVYDKAYSYFRNFGPSASIPMYEGETATVSFNAKAGDVITAVGFETLSADFTANVVVRASGQTATGGINTKYAGFYVIELDNDITLASDAVVSVELSFSKDIKLSLENTGSLTYGDVVLTNQCESGFDDPWFHYDYDPMIVMYTAKVYTQSIALNHNSLNMRPGDNASLSATILPSNATNKALTWTTSNASVATVSSNGQVTAVAPGTATITATANDGSGKSATCTVTVTSSNVLVSGITLNKSSISINDNQTFQLSATVAPSNATNKGLTWSSSNTSVATVSSNGLVTPVAPGTATITATAKDGSGKTATCLVTVSLSNNLIDFRPYVAPEGCVFQYRLYNPNSGEHFYTGSQVEAVNLKRAGWNFEGSGFITPTVGTPIYRLYSAEHGDHFYTTSVTERDELLAERWTLDGGTGIAFPSATAETGRPMYRLHNPNAYPNGEAGAHHFTMSWEEVQNLVDVGWEYEFVAWYSV